MTQELATQLTPQQQGWLSLADYKQQVFTALQQGELAIQATLANLPDDLLTVQERLKAAKQQAAQVKECRLQFTGMINDRLIKSSMEFEKRIDALIATAATLELKLRKAAEAVELERAALQREEQQLQAHIVNENYRVETEYRNAINRWITDFYAGCLRKRIPQPDLSELQGIIENIKVSAPSVFQIRLVSRPRAEEIYSAIQRPDLAAIRDGAIASLPERFSMYAHDLQNAEAAAKAVEEAQATQEAEAKQTVELTAATNVLMAQAETVAVGAPKVKRNLKVVEENSEKWALAVMGHFIKNLPAVAPKLRVKSWAKLNIGQMAEALAKVAGETGELFTGLTMEEIEK